MLRIICCLAVFALYLYQMIQKQNVINYLSLQIPKVTKDLKAIEEENVRLHFEIESFESPDHLMQLVKMQEYTHLRYPSLKEVITVPEGVALHIKEEPKKELFRPLKTHPVLAVGAKR
jgi:hypothetical protein